MKRIIYRPSKRGDWCKYRKLPKLYLSVKVSNLLCTKKRQTTNKPVTSSAANVYPIWIHPAHQ